MARRQLAPKFQHTLWDRLTNPELIRGENVGVTASSEIERIKNEVRRDIEWLLNTRRSPIDLPKAMTQLNKSLATYGLPDFTSMSLSDPMERDRLVRILENVIRDFEPRLFNVAVSFNPMTQDRFRSSLHYRIEAMLRVDPAPESIAFDTFLELGSKSFTVRNEGE